MIRRGNTRNPSRSPFRGRLYGVRHSAPWAAGLFCLLALFASGCSFFAPEPDLMPAPEEVRESAYDSAEKYIGMDYDYGGQDHYSSRGIDCSGLVVNCYAEAVSNTVYRLPYGDAAVADFRDRYTSEVQQPERGDRRG